MNRLVLGRSRHPKEHLRSSSRAGTSRSSVPGLARPICIPFFPEASSSTPPPRAAGLADTAAQNIAAKATPWPSRLAAREVLQPVAARPSAWSLWQCSTSSGRDLGSNTPLPSPPTRTAATTAVGAPAPVLQVPSPSRLQQVAEEAWVCP